MDLKDRVCHWTGRLEFTWLPS